jgi:IMP dehydrogenase/GMP reductase
MPIMGRVRAGAVVVVHLKRVHTGCRLTRTIELNIPLMSAAMDTVN